tara:strand:+ start:315 stop:782 length:468 start_codon:yes stop_codon:yes gene_type:complete
MNKDILEGLKVAVARGESLKQAMQSFYNAGYERKEIEEAAKDVQHNISEEQIKGKTPDIIPKQKRIDKKFKSDGISRFPKRNFQNKEKDVGNKDKTLNSQTKLQQKISNYEQKKHPRKKLIIIISSVLLILVIISLTGIFFFKDSLTELFSKIFG